MKTDGLTPSLVMGWTQKSACTKLFTFLELSIFLKILFIFREKGKEGERDRNINVWLHLTRPLLGTWPRTQANAVTEN